MILLVVDSDMDYIDMSYGRTDDATRIFYNNILRIGDHFGVCISDDPQCI